MTNDSSESTSPPWTLAGFNLGMRLALPVLPGMIAFGLAVAPRRAQGIQFLDNLLMNAFVYAGMSQLVAMEAWLERVTLGAIAASRSHDHDQRPHAADERGPLPWLQCVVGMAEAYPTLQSSPILVVDRDALSLRGRLGHRHPARVERAVGGRLDRRDLCRPCRRPLIADPRRDGIDLVMPVFFAAMLIPLWRAETG